MKVSAALKNKLNEHTISVQTDNTSREIKIDSRNDGYGSAVNGAELLLLSLATCFCNDIYREAKLKNIRVSEVSVSCHADFGAAGEAGANFTYSTNIVADASPGQIEELIKHTDRVAEIHNTLRKGMSVSLVI